MMSLILTKNYINNWIKKTILLYQAEKNLPDDKLEFEKQLEDYRNSLVIYQYESMLIQQRLDTVISEEEMEHYYQNHKQNFELKDNIVKVNYIKTSQSDKKLNRYKKLLLSKEQTDRDSLIFYCENNAETFLLDSSRWVLFQDLRPCRTEDLGKSRAQRNVFLMYQLYALQGKLFTV